MNVSQNTFQVHNIIYRRQTTVLYLCIVRICHYENLRMYVNSQVLNPPKFSLLT